MTNSGVPQSRPVPKVINSKSINWLLIKVINDLTFLKLKKSQVIDFDFTLRFFMISEHVCHREDLSLEFWDG